MISYIRGELVALEEDKVIVDVGGVGYGIFMSGQAMGQLEDVLDHQVEAANGAAEDTVNAQGLQADAVQALTALGYGSTEALQAVRKVEMDESTTVEDLLKGALKYLI